MKQLLTLCLALSALPAVAHPEWTLQQCMQYAVEHNHEVKVSALELDNYKAAKTGAVGHFLPVAEGGIGAQYNFGRAIDPETNVYTDVSTFYNSYYVSASLPVFDGLNRLYALKAAKASELMGRQALRRQQDQTALRVMEAFANVVYYEGMVQMATEKVEETTLLLAQTRLLEQVGRKGLSDVADVASQRAEADYELTRQQNLHASALLELKMQMAFPLDDSLSIAWNEPWEQHRDSVWTNDALRPADNADLQVAKYNIQASKQQWRQARSSFFPSLSLSVGANTTYYETLHAPAASFNRQFNNNMGEYVAATLTIPLFNRLQTVTTVRRARNNYRIAQENYEQKRLELDKLCREAWQDWLGYEKQTLQMEQKVKADSLAYQLTRRQFEEGLRTALDVHTTSAQLLRSKATLLQCRLMAIMKEQYVKYYQGYTIWTE